MFNVPFSHNENLWEHNPHLQILKPFSYLYNNDTSNNKIDSSKILWCIVWLCHPDEDKNRFYRLPPDELMDHCKSFSQSFDPNDEIVKECMSQFPRLCLTLIEASYKESKDQLFKLTRFLNQQDITLENAEMLIKLKANIPKIYADFAKTDKEFEKSKATQRIHGGRQRTLRERNVFEPEE